MKRERQISNAIALVQARRIALGLPVSTVPTRVTDTTLYLVSRIDGTSNIAKLTNDDTKKKVGVTNFDGNKLADGRDAIIDGIKILCAKDGLVQSNVDFNSKVIIIPPALLNAELKLVQSNVILLNIPVADLYQNSYDNDGYRDIASTPYLAGKEPIEWILEYPEGASIPADIIDGVYIKIMCRAIQAIQ